MNEKLLALERRAGKIVYAANLLGVAEKGSYYPWRNAKRVLPQYIENSVDAHLALSDAEFGKRLRDVVKIRREKRELLQLIRTQNWAL